ncbi:MAG: hypothetical protein HDT39_13620 [Lachnospiraceae bacterium]|nr:hypothetical protein [Lachnospiraceae bacterium]
MENNQTVTVGNMADMQGKKSTGNSTPTESTNQVIQPIPEIPIISGNPTQNPDNKSVTKNPDNGLSTSVTIIKKNGDPVNMATGEYIYEDKDFIIPDMDSDFSLIRRYTGPAGRTTRHSLGKVWELSTDTNITIEENTAIVTMPDGKTAEFTARSNSYTNKKGGTKKYMLEKNKNGYTFTDNPKKQKYYYDQSGQIIKKTDRNGNATEYRYNENGLDRLILPTGYKLTFRWENNKIAEIADNAGRTVKYKYEKGLLKKAIRCDGTEIKYSYDENENLKTITDASGCTYLENEYDDSHRIKKQTITDGETYIYTYDEKNRTNTIKEQENGAVTTYIYDRNKEITCIKYPDGSEEKIKTDDYSNISEETDRCGAVTAYTYDIMGNLLVKKEPSGLITHHEYTENCLTKTWDNAGRQTKYKYDGNCNLTEKRVLTDEKTGKEYITLYGYDSYGRITEKRENERTTSFRYTETFPKPVLITSPDGTETRLKYDTAGRLKEKTTENITEKYTYTQYNKLKTYTDGEGNKTTYNYDECWRLAEIIKPAQKKGETYRYDSMDRPVSHTDECGRVTIYRRNAYGDIIQIIKCGVEEDIQDHYNAINCMEESITYEYDTCHRIIKKQIGKYGHETYNYDKCGRITGKTQNSYNNENEQPDSGYRYKRDNAGRITEATDPYGNITDAYSYDLYGNVKKHIHSPAILKEMAEMGETAENDRYPGDIYSYNALGLMTSKKELLTLTKEGKPLYCINKYTYDTDGNLIIEKTYTEPQPDTDTPYGKARKILRKYDECGRLTEIKDETGAKATYEYDRHGRKIRETAKQDNEKSRITEYEYNCCGKITKQKIYEKTDDKSPQKPAFKRKNGNRFLETVKTEKQPEITEKLIEVTEYAYDMSGQMVKAIMPDGLIISYTYDESGKRTSVTASDAKNPAVRRKNIYKYDKYGYITEKTENGITAIYENDAFGNILKEKNADGGTAVYGYDFNGKCICSITPEENRKSGENAKGTITEYDLCGRPVKITSPDGIILEEYTYDSSGKLLIQKNADGGSIKYGYDAGGRMIYAVTAAGVRSEYSYDTLGNITSQSLGDDISHFENDVWGHILGIKTCEDIEETYEYDRMGNLTAATDGEGRKREYHRDIRGNAGRITYADGSMETFGYDYMGRMVSKTYRSGKKVNYVYDIFGNPVKMQAEPKDGAEIRDNRDSCIYEYTEDGMIKSATGGGIKYTYGYDICGRLKSKSACGRMLISYEYDLNGNKKSVTDATGKTTYYEYDMADRLVSISECNKKLAGYNYTPYGKVSKVVCGDIITEYEYDPDGRYGRIKVTVGGSILSDIHYEYDNKGNCVRKVNVTGGVNAVTDYKYDGVGRLTGVKRPDLKERYSYDRAGNRITYANDKGISESYNYNETNELLSIVKSQNDGGISEVRKFTYDADGNMTSDGRGIYSYDGFNRMAEAAMEDGRSLVCRYDAEGLRHETEENGRLIKFIYSGRDAVCEEEEEKGFTRYIRGNGRLVTSDSESARTYYHYACDSLGSVDYVIAGNEFGCDGNYGSIDQRILCRYGYDAFGNTVDAFEHVGNRYCFTGEMHDDVTGMYYLRARYYSSGIGRFTQADTYHGDGLNLYVYAGNNPVRYVDPSGHCCKNGNVDGSDSPSDSYLYQRYKESLVKDDILNNSNEIISGDKFGDEKLIVELTKDGSDIGDWSKMESVYSYTNEYGTGKIHYYKNIKTGKISYYDAKMKISVPKSIRNNLKNTVMDKGYFWIVDLDENLIPIGVRQ